MAAARAGWRRRVDVVTGGDAGGESQRCIMNRLVNFYPRQLCCCFVCLCYNVFLSIIVCVKIQFFCCRTRVRPRRTVTTSWYLRKRSSNSRPTKTSCVISVTSCDRSYASALQLCSRVWAVCVPQGLQGKRPTMRIKSSHRTVATAITEMTCGLLVFVTRQRNYQETVKKTFVRVLRFLRQLTHIFCQLRTSYHIEVLVWWRDAECS